MRSFPPSFRRSEDRRKLVTRGRALRRLSLSRHRESPMEGNEYVVAFEPLRCACLLSTPLGS